MLGNLFPPSKMEIILSLNYKTFWQFGFEMYTLSDTGKVCNIYLKNMSREKKQLSVLDLNQGRDFPYVE